MQEEQRKDVVKIEGQLVIYLRMKQVISGICSLRNGRARDVLSECLKETFLRRKNLVTNFDGFGMKS